jgi:hypothetical protein
MLSETGRVEREERKVARACGSTSPREEKTVSTAVMQEVQHCAYHSQENRILQRRQLPVSGQPPCSIPLRSSSTERRLRRRYSWLDEVDGDGEEDEGEGGPASTEPFEAVFLRSLEESVDEEGEGEAADAGAGKDDTAGESSADAEPVGEVEKYWCPEEGTADSDEDLEREGLVS